VLALVSAWGDGRRSQTHPFAWILLATALNGLLMGLAAAPTAALTGTGRGEIMGSILIRTD
jgi:hypothetical protein